MLMLHVNTIFAVRIYQGQRMVLGQSSDGPLLREMQVSNSTITRNFPFIYSPHKAHEEAHLAGISQAAHRHRADASVLLPVWSAAALALGVFIRPHRSVSMIAD
jgi:demethoxyubiquinone hydroxylase (CLK1/Coq7/Cat5 family)